ncbi:hypothetical protein C2845_PM14G17550 [Panicum miliaceum]|uniref:Uncharacterized protein n=1 Tax=Panicum miliaceum TaxID=4540 RepID=A0A3L6PKW8_PANMI|nr:hypothetical protein C2845_PM14G17550 [Panicum miliaceum]
MLPVAPAVVAVHAVRGRRRGLRGDPQFFLWNLGSECFVVNSFAAIDGAYVERALPDLMAKRVFAVGPLSDAVSISRDRRGGKPAVPAARVAAWLDAFPDGSAVYVSFGTQHALSPPQAACVADALARSSAAFVWSVEILRHRAVGWFLTHCGWNSALEATAGGVTLLTWPMGTEQFTNAWLVTEVGVAVPVAEGAEVVPDAGQMAGAIAAATGEEGKREAREGARGGA